MIIKTNIFLKKVKCDIMRTDMLNCEAIGNGIHRKEGRLMNEREASCEKQKELKQYLSPLAVWALSFGCAVGWGAFVMPGTTFLPIAGPLGTVLGILAGGLIMLIIGICYHYMINHYPDCGGTFSYVKNELGYDRGFLSTWFLILVYIAIIWANATAIPLICKKLLHGMFEVGPHYEVAGFEVYILETLVAVAALLLAGGICYIGGRFAAAIQTFFALLLIGGILLGAGVIFLGKGIPPMRAVPAFAPDKGVPGMQVFCMAALAPWAYAGFESISHSAEEFRFSHKKTMGIMAASLLTCVAAYALLALIAVSAVPEGYLGWTEYIGQLSDLEGRKGLPVFHAADVYMGKSGLILLGLAVAAGIMTGLIGNMIAASRLIFSMARDRMLPERFAQLNKRQIPGFTILFITLLSLPIPFFGRTAIGWIVDVNTIGATIAYAYTCVTAYLLARREKNVPVKILGAVGALISLIFTLYFLIPNIWSVSKLATESYMILIVWGILGFVFFRYVFIRDTQRRFGRTTVVWLVLLFLIFFLSMLWFREATQDTTRGVLDNLNAYNESELAEHGIVPDDKERLESGDYLEKQIGTVNQSLKRNSYIQMSIIFIALFIMFHVYNLMSKRERQMELKKLEAEQTSKAKSVFLSNMSHDIRTPMNAIIGYTGLAKQVENVPQTELDYLDKIEASGKQLLALINDVLDLSRIESGKMELDVAPEDLLKVMEEIRNLFVTQMEMKKITFTVQTQDITNKMVMCDANRLNRVLLNLLSNALKFTPEGGTVSVLLKQSAVAEDSASYEIRVKDSGMGMSPEFAATVFEAYSRDRSVNNIQGTGLGMAITKNIVDLMNGEIDVVSELGKGTEFIIHVDFALAEEQEEQVEASGSEEAAAVDFSHYKLLLVEDQMINRELATMILQQYGFALECAENGQIAVDKIASSAPGEFQAVLMDIQMPVMNGYEAAKAIRALSDPALANIPIIAMTANAFTEDIQAAKEAGMNSHVAKPIDINKLIETLTEVLS